MPRLLVNSPSGEQIIIEIDPTGDYYDATQVLWDESRDGAMPDIILGKMQRVNGLLVTLPDYLPGHAAAMYAKQIPESVPMPAAKQALIEAGLMTDVETFVSTLTQAQKVWYTDSVFINKDDELVEQFRISKGMTGKQISDLFIAADIINKQRLSKG